MCICIHIYLYMYMYCMYTNTKCICNRFMCTVIGYTYIDRPPPSPLYKYNPKLMRVFRKK